MKKTKINQQAQSGGTYAKEKYDFRIIASPRNASVIKCAKNMVEDHYGTKMTNAVFLAILCTHWVTGKKPVFETHDERYTVEELENI